MDDARLGSQENYYRCLKTVLNRNPSIYLPILLLLLSSAAEQPGVVLKSVVGRLPGGLIDCRQN